MRSDRVALVTGAARGQGAAIVERLHKDGFRVAACDLLADELAAAVEARGMDGVIAVALDVTSEDQWAAAVNLTIDRFGALTTLVNNAGVLHRASLAEETPHSFETSWRVNCLGPFLGIRASLERPTASRGRFDRQHLQYRRRPAVPGPCRVRLVQVGAAGPDPDCRRGTRPVGHQGQCGAAGPRRDSDARRADSGPPCRHGATRQADGDRRRRGVPGLRAGVVHHRLRTCRGRRAMPANRVSPSVGIIGAGPGGLALGIFLRRAGFRDFTIFDREDGVGGTWRINTYPGLACDVKSHLYSYSFDLNANWSRLWSGQPEILDYFERCAQRYELGPNLRLHTEITAARWDAGTTTWQLSASNGEEYSFDVVVSAVGLFTRPVLPDRRGRAVRRYGDAHGPLGSLRRPGRGPGRRARHRLDRIATCSRSREGRQGGVLRAALADVDPAEAGPALHRA